MGCVCPVCSCMLGCMGAYETRDGNLTRKPDDLPLPLLGWVWESCNRVKIGFGRSYLKAWAPPIPTVVPRLMPQGFFFVIEIKATSFWSYIYIYIYIYIFLNRPK